MEENITILKNRKLPASQDYAFLRSEGLKHIENLGSALWTDYNEHDPGITILEALCYAITELGYKNDFEIKDLLTQETGEIVAGQIPFTAKKILTNNPLTLNDYRKLLIDIEGVHNAWLMADDSVPDETKIPRPVNEIPLYADCKNDKLIFEETANPLFLSGLYRVLLDLENDERFGDLNNGEILIGNPATANFNDSECWFFIELPNWKNANILFSTAASDKTHITTVATTAVGNRWNCNVLLSNGSSINFIIAVSKKPALKTIKDSDIISMFDNNTEFVARIFKAHLDKIAFAKQIVQEAIKRLHDHRNLCEDFVSVTTIDDEKISFCFDIDANPDTDIEKVQAEAFYLIENYLNPSVDFFSLKELLEKNIPVDEIFNGTVLDHGFIDTAQLEQTQLRSVIYSSDIINLLMDIEGVRSVRNFVMTKYDQQGKAVTGYIGLKWCMDITPLHKPVLNIQGSKILLFKNQFPFIANYNEVRDTLSVLYAQRSRAKLKGLQNDLPFPIGRKRDTESYHPIQYDFPLTYGIGEFGLPANASPERIAQQRQLKAYLMFYEQLLADFLSQLTNAHRLFSITEIKNTYHAQFLAGIKDLEVVYRTEAGNNLLEKLMEEQDATRDPKNGWQKLYEPIELFEDRRNRFLDHMLARFSESFNDYALLMYTINHDTNTEEKISFTELTAAKMNTLQQYDTISSMRGVGFNYFPQHNDFTLDTDKFWDTLNVSGLEKRISFLTGLTDYSRRFLYCISRMEVTCSEESVEENGIEILKCFHSFTFTSITGVEMVSKKYEKKEDAENARDEVLKLAIDEQNYLFNNTGPTSDNTLEIIGESNEVIIKSITTFPDRETARTQAKLIAEEFKKPCKPLGLHLLEHNLLRPRTADFDRLEVCLDDCDCLCEQDPYTFRASVVLPYWPGHFENMAFREYFEHKIREEAPAHIMLKVCWLSNELMMEFEKDYKEWIESLAAYSFDKPANLGRFMNANNKIIGILKRLHSEYPVANLHNCEESKEGSNTVVLGKTILGTYKN